MEELEGTKTNSKYVMVQGVGEGERARLGGGPPVTGAPERGEISHHVWRGQKSLLAVRVMQGVPSV